jgi:small-conductance mechanosensitive channel
MPCANKQRQSRQNYRRQMANNTIDYRIKFAIESKEYQQALRKANQEAKEFKRQQREAFKNSGANEGMNAIIASAKKFAPAISASAAALAVVNKAMRENQTYTDE